MAPGDTPVIFYICLRESPRPVNRTIISIVTGRLSVGMTTTKVWIGDWYTATVRSSMRPSQTRHPAFGSLGKSELLVKKKGWRDSRPTKLCPRVARDLLYIVGSLLLTLTLIFISCGNDCSTGRVIPYNWRPVYLSKRQRLPDEVWDETTNFIPQFTEHVITFVPIHARIELNLCQ